MVGLRFAREQGESVARPQFLWVTRKDLPVLAAYAISFHLAHSLAAWWGGAGFYSLWFPAAGLRFALLWVFGVRLTLAATLIELIVQLLAGVLRIGTSDWITMAISIARPALAYGLSMWLVERLTRERRSTLSTPPMPFGFAAVLAPVSAALAALPWSLFRPELTGVQNARDIVASLSTFVTGDLLGVLLVAPPLIYLADLWLGRETRAPRLPGPAELVEGALVLGVGIFLVWLLATMDIGRSGMPLVLAACWIGLRLGRTAAWFTNIIVAGLVFPWTSRFADFDSKLDLHMSVAAVAVAGYVAASFSAALQRSREEIQRRDRLLLQAERLKTLRSMSVAVIHEVSQPLSTLVLESRHLRQAAEARGDSDLAETARLVETKSASLASLTRSLRDFGSRGRSQPEVVSLQHCLEDAIFLLRHEARAARVQPKEPLPSDPVKVRANGIELTQALLNLLRNAVQASQPHAVVETELRLVDGEASLRIYNEVHQAPSPQGMGVGGIIARTIVEAGGGRILQHWPCPREVVTEVRLPLENGI